MNTYNLQRFLDAQERTYDTALAEIRAGRKQSHWIWYIFPQLKGLGHSYNSNYYGLDGIEEAKAYFSHPVLRQRLLEITEALLQHSNMSATEILGTIDARKVQSCATLFWMATNEPIFSAIINQFYGGTYDKQTLKKVII
ncbi:MAG: DUF1810 domain-containing protein [Bacteroidales bacterium]|nr:DUF1810 domain-containing protein [Bacteroidales bacterium]